MAAFELVALVYFAAIAAAAAAVPGPAARRRAVAVAALVAAAAVAGIAVSGVDVMRAWLPHAYLVAGYWLPGLLATGVAHPTRFETWLTHSDERLRARLPAVPAWLRHVTEAAYLVCYPLVPLSFAIVWARGSSADVAWFWVAVLLAGYGCYASLSWLVSRPPRLAAGPPHAARDVGAVNVFVLARVSHQLNTFPSGHVAVSTAAAVALARVSPAAGAFVGAVAVAIAVGAAAGRYHYVADVALGAAVALVALVAAGLVI
jgi:hypothetical protein